MSIAVYPRLAELLETSNMTVAELERHISDRYGLAVDVETLYRLTQMAPIQRADLEIAGAVTAILGVGLDDLFRVDAVPVDGDSEEELQVLNLADSRRMAALVEQQGRHLLSDAEWAELEELTYRYGQLLHERRVRARAQRHGSTLEQEQGNSTDLLARALIDWQASGIEAQQALYLHQ